jgi:signal transduction histidine kinase
MSALVWGRRVTKEIFQLVLMIWKSRNDGAHGISRTMESPLTRIRLMAQIVALQQSNPDVTYTERDFIYRSISDLETYSLCNLKAWYHQAVTVIKVSNNRTRTASKQFQNLSTIPQYFNPVCMPVFNNLDVSSNSDPNNELVATIELSQ